MMVSRYGFTRRGALALGAVAGLGTLVRPASGHAAGASEDLHSFTLPLPRGTVSSGVNPPLDAPQPFDLLGLSGALAGAHLQVRTRRRGGAWSRWIPVAAAADHAPDGGRAGAASDPIWTGRADQLQLRGTRTPGALRVHFVRAPTPRAHARGAAGIASAKSAAVPVSAFGSPAMVMRDGWATTAVKPRNDPSFGRIDMAFVHHTETGNDYGPDESPAIVLSIARYHRDTNGWSDIGYNFLVDQYGTIFEGRAGGIDKAVVGAQAQGYNSFSTGISCIGGYMTTALPDAAMRSVAKLIAWKLGYHGTPVAGTLVVTSGGGELNAHPYGQKVTMHRIAGHRDGDSTDCPGDKLYHQLPALRTLAEGLAGEEPAKPAGSSKMTIVADRTVAVYGSAAAVHGVITDPAGNAVTNKQIAVEKQGASKKWSRLATVRSGSDGSWSASVPWKATGRLRARATVTGHSVVSPMVTISVTPKLTAGALPKSVKPNGAVVVTGTVLPAATVKVVLQKKLSSGRWAAAGTRTVKPSSRGAIRSTFRFAGPAQYRISLAAGSVATSPATVTVGGVAKTSSGSVSGGVSAGA